MLTLESRCLLVVIRGVLILRKTPKPQAAVLIISIASHSPPTRHSQNPYALKPVLPPHFPIRPSQYEAMEIINTAAPNSPLHLFCVYFNQMFQLKVIKMLST